MAVIVEFNPETYAELFQDVLKDFPSLLDGLCRDFARYIESDRLWLPPYFGRDVPYVVPQEAYRAGLMHIHIAIPPTVFPANRPQRDRTCPNGAPQQDAALVYVQGLFEETRYSLLALLHPDAHGKARQREMMTYLARVASRFRDKY
ncbi:type II toxin-antitoxin system YafO family toxin [Pseudomonas aeruginosa]|uniref:type II toxin-antitoxin system YafO family toxin n=1 Tax=Pseudomonas aeruginosa TaxID=287 RepID=UPI0021E99A41|nr:type II toxin-antitoxin system YafO family toxin [Pseudomonas aeruginosa]MCV3851688.1 type II toxin-antitoxin system YafO family toxin [Pseudomonas aeruginosa]MCV3857719.1 type II toxin-antitoxin system YafO family toxin [Pseudomonas aeruginosa]